jgi:RNA polymerase sigma factor (sigma-70 family)
LSTDNDEFLRSSIQRYGASVLKKCRAIVRDGILAEDAFQQTFLAFTRWLRASETPDIESIGGLLQVMAERASIDLYRRRERQERLAHGQSASSEASAGEWLYVDELLSSLSPRERRIVELSVFAGMKAPEIAHDLGLEPGAVRVAKSRAFRKLRLLAKRDVTVRGGAGDE